MVTGISTARTLDHLTSGPPSNPGVNRTANHMRFTPERHHRLLDVVQAIATLEPLIDVATEIDPNWLWLHYPLIEGEAVSSPHYLSKPCFKEEDFAAAQHWCQLAILSRGWQFSTQGSAKDGILSTVTWGDGTADNACPDPILGLLLAYLRALRIDAQCSTVVES